MALTEKSVCGSFAAQSCDGCAAAWIIRSKGISLKTASKLAIQVLGATQDYNNLNIPKSQEVVGRLISFGVRCTWTEEQTKELATKISECVVKAMQTVNA